MKIVVAMACLPLLVAGRADTQTRDGNLLKVGYQQWASRADLAYDIAAIQLALALLPAQNGRVGTEDTDSEPQARGGVFATTHWSVVLAAGDPASPTASVALETLCRTYWYPLYAYLRRSGHPPADAEDLVQGFFLHLLRLELLHSVQREGGRFRSFLLTALKHFLWDEKAKAAAQKRGGGHQFVSWEQTQAEQSFLREPADIASADRLFERRWALTLLEEAMSRLQEECVANGNAERFMQLKGFVSGEKGELSYAEAAERTGLTPSAVKSAIFRFRRRYHELIREEVGHTVADPREIEEELRYLLKFFSEG